MRSAIECWGLTKNYRGLRALDGLSLKIEPGEFFGLLGPNGAGKSTFIKIMVGLVRQSAGWAQVGDAPAGGIRAKETFGYLPELFRFPSWMTGRELLRLHGRLIGLSSTDISTRSAEVLELTGMAQAAERVDGQLESRVRRGRWLSDPSGGDLDILLGDRADDVLGRHIPRLQFLRIKPNSHAVIGATEVRDIANAPNTA